MSAPTATQPAAPALAPDLAEVVDLLRRPGLHGIKTTAIRLVLAEFEGWRGDGEILDLVFYDEQWEQLSQEVVNPFLTRRFGPDFCEMELLLRREARRVLNEREPDWKEGSGTEGYVEFRLFDDRRGYPSVTIVGRVLRRREIVVESGEF